MGNFCAAKVMTKTMLQVIICNGGNMEDHELAYAVCMCDMMAKIVMMNIKLFSSNELDVLNNENIVFKSADHPLTSWNENIYSLTTAFKNLSAVTVNYMFMI